MCDQNRVFYVYVWSEDGLLCVCVIRIGWVGYSDHTYTQTYSILVTHTHQTPYLYPHWPNMAISAAYTYTHPHTYTYISTYLYTHTHIYIHIHIHTGMSEGCFFRSGQPRPQNAQTFSNFGNLPAKKRSRENEEFAPNYGAKSGVPSAQDWKNVGIIVGQGLSRRVIVGMEFAPPSFNVASKVRICVYMCIVCVYACVCVK